MSLLFITDFLPPGFSATGQYTYHFAKCYSKKKIKTSLIGIGNLDKTTEEPIVNKNEPIVESQRRAIETFRRTSIDFLNIDNYLIFK